ncbi:alkylmercury lyase family protein [Micromonospora sp. CPCC 205371]|nr:alkylmercury lyase family protein [Micromonospora sp. CPCC 205371]
MIVELRSIPDCPNLAAARDLLYQSLGELGIATRVVSEVLGDYPSPSVVVNGVDVMGGIAERGSPACRLDLPTAEHLRAALQRAIAAEPDDQPAGTALPVTDCCAPSSGDAIRTDRPRRAARLPDGLREVHRAILMHFATTGIAPDGTAISTFAAAVGVDPAAAIDALAAEDLVAVDAGGRLVAAYPFSPTPTSHMVVLGVVRVYAMCAIDALGMPYMLDTDAVITSTDPHTGQPVHVTVTDRSAAWRPAEAVVVYAANAAGGRSVDSCCSTINFFTSAGSAQAWIAAHPALTATVLDLGQAVTLGRDIFEPLLTGPGAGVPGQP